MAGSPGIWAGQNRTPEARVEDPGSRAEGPRAFGVPTSRSGSLRTCWRRRCAFHGRSGCGGCTRAWARTIGNWRRQPTVSQCDTPLCRSQLPGRTRPARRRPTPSRCPNETNKVKRASSGRKQGGQGGRAVREKGGGADLSHRKRSGSGSGGSKKQRVTRQRGRSAEGEGHQQEREGRSEKIHKEANAPDQRVYSSPPKLLARSREDGQGRSPRGRLGGPGGKAGGRRRGGARGGG